MKLTLTMPQVRDAVAAWLAAQCPGLAVDPDAEPTVVDAAAADDPVEIQVPVTLAGPAKGG